LRAPFEEIERSKDACRCCGALRASTQHCFSRVLGLTGAQPPPLFTLFFPVPFSLWRSLYGSQERSFHFLLVSACFPRRCWSPPAAVRPVFAAPANPAFEAAFSPPKAHRRRSTLRGGVLRRSSRCSAFAAPLCVPLSRRSLLLSLPLQLSFLRLSRRPDRAPADQPFTFAKGNLLSFRMSALFFFVSHSFFFAP